MKNLYHESSAYSLPCEDKPLFPAPDRTELSTSSSFASLRSDMSSRLRWTKEDDDFLSMQLHSNFMESSYEDLLLLGDSSDVESSSSRASLTTDDDDVLLLPRNPLKSALKKRKNKKGSETFKKSVQFMADDEGSCYFSLEFVPRYSQEECQRLWWTAEEIAARKEEWTKLVESLRHEDACFDLVERLLECPEDRDHTLRRLEALYPDARGMEVHISQKCRDATYMHRVLVLDTVDEVERYGLRDTDEGAEIIRESSVESSQLVREFVQQMTM